MAKRRATGRSGACRPGSRQGPRNGTGPRGGTKACPKTKKRK